MSDGAGEPLDKRERLRRLRRERLLALLPRIYGAQPEGSVVAALVDALAGRLGALDESAERVLRDRWVALAGGEPRWDDGPHPLEWLGELLGVRREPWEEPERFRRRLRASAPVVTHGSTTVRAVLTLAAAALDTELCPRLARLPEDSEAADTTLGLGVKPGTLASCPGCADPEAESRCHWDQEKPQQGAVRGRAGQNPIEARMLLTDGPISERELAFTGLGHAQTFRVRSFSLAADRPVVRLRAQTEVRYPALRNVGNNGITLFAGTLAAGETLELLPERLEADVAPFVGYFTAGPALQRSLDAEGRARVRGPDGRVLRVVSDRVFFLQGRALFDVSVFSGPEARDARAARFALLERRVLTPLLEPGEVTWDYQGYTATDVKALADPVLAEALKDAPASPTAGKVDLSLEWWVRPPATFRLRVPAIPTRAGVERSDVLELVRRSVERARAAGVRVSVDFPEPPRLETHPLREKTPAVAVTARGSEDARARETLEAKVGAKAKEAQPLGEGLLTVRGIFDATRLDWSRFAP